jgi:hypothetical protein
VFRLPRFATYSVAAGVIVGYVVYDTWGAPQRLRSGLGVIIIVVTGLIFSKHPGRVSEFVLYQNIQYR